jgi:hypothetical protein
MGLVSMTEMCGLMNTGDEIMFNEAAYSLSRVG